VEDSYSDVLNINTFYQQATFADGCLLLVIFYQKRMILRNHTNNIELLRVACGGSHRWWHINVEDPFANRCIFGFIRSSKILLHVSATESNPILAKLIDPLHGREIRSICMLENNYILSGSEDTSLVLSQIKQDRLAVVTRYSKHVSVIKSIARCKSYIFTGGGSEDLFAWKYESDSSPPRLYDISTCIPVSQSLENRVMSLEAVEWDEDSIVLVAGYSDGFVRLILFKKDSARFYMVGELKVEHCILSITCCLSKYGTIFLNLHLAGLRN
jgi:WD40 repeat protein